MGHNTNYARNMLLNDSNSDDDLEIIVLLALEEERLERERVLKSHCGSIPGRRFIQRDHEQGHQRLFQDYFAESPVYPLNKMITALRMLAYAVAADFTDEYVRIGEITAIESLKKFVKVIVDIYSTEYLRSLNRNDIARLLRVGESRGFPGMLGSIDFTHWKWKNCPSGWKDERDANGAEDFDYEQVPESIPTTVSHEPTKEFSQFTVFIAAHEKIRNKETHSELQFDLVEHLCQ
ncbi:hypothetical protein SO802_023936 [Lithocarpus litseifolius]|uniref:Nuclease HARBI1 n=1 Tax=Lithocarpus litseifolius TaxID=425828 RepID=A0AAW2C9S6_9ROSI